MANAQQIQWASKLIFQYNQFSDNDWSGLKTLGPPDASPFGSPNKNAFRIKSESGYGTVSVGFDHPQPVSQIVIVENNKPGNIVKVVLHDTAGNEYTVYQAEPQIVSKSYNTFTLKFDKTTYNVAEVAVHVNTYKNKGWSQIDAIGISEEQFDGDILPESKDSLQTAEEVTFTAAKERLSNNVNSDCDESKPIISPDGSRLYFARKSCPQNFGGRRDDQDIYYADLIGKDWSLARNIGAPLNDRLPNGICSVTPDGNSLLLINAYDDRGNVEDGVSISRKTLNGWTRPLKQNIIGFENKSEFQDYCLANSGNILILAVQRSDSHGDQDLYVSFKTGDNEWTKPKNLGVSINTPNAEFSPFLASDNKTLYFASNGHGGFGQSDIFYSRRLDDSWVSWTEPKNLGKNINSSGWDAYYTISARGDFAYFISTPAAFDPGSRKDNEDIYRISLSKDVQPDPVVMITGRVLNSKTKQPIEADIFYESIPTGSEKGLANSNPGSGEFKIVLPAGKKYGFRAQSNGYVSVDQNEDFTAVKQFTEIKRDLYLTPLEVGEVVQLNNLFFAQSKAEMLPESQPELERLYQLLVDNKNLEIELSGHTDNQGNSNANMQLSRDRAEAVMQFLIDKGIDKKRLTAVGYGPTRPIASNANPETRKLNRRVEIKILKF